QQSRSSLRNVFRRSETELNEVSSDKSTTSVYFRKTRHTSIEIESELKKVTNTSVEAVTSRNSWPLKRNTGGKIVAKNFSDDSDFDETAFEDLKPKKNDKTTKANLNVSVSSIEDEDKAILTNLNGTQSS